LLRKQKSLSHELEQQRKLNSPYEQQRILLKEIQFVQNEIDRLRTIFDE